MQILFFIFYSVSLFAQNNCDHRFQTILEQNQIETTELEAKKNSGTQIIRRIENSIDRQDIHFISGVPNKVKIVTAESLGIVRHYSLKIDEIIASGKLIAGPRPYIIPEAHRREEFIDLNGIFFTTKSFDPKKLWMGFDHKTPYIDFKLPADLGILYLADGNFLIPGPSSKPAWIKSAYENYERTGVTPTYLRADFELIREKGGLKDPIEIPIEIINIHRP